VRIETRSLPFSLVATSRLYLLCRLSLSLHCISAASRIARPLLLFPIAMPGFLVALAALGTSRRKVNSNQRFAGFTGHVAQPVAPLKLSRFPLSLVATSRLYLLCRLPQSLHSGDVTHHDAILNRFLSLLIYPRNAADRHKPSKSLLKRRPKFSRMPRFLKKLRLRELRRAVSGERLKGERGQW
jgi:hypothetical protein